MLNIKLLPRPFSSDRPRVEGYEPIVRGKIERINRRKRNSWRAEVSVDDCAMTLSHHDTKVEAESFCERMIKTYAEIHYFQV